MVSCDRTWNGEKLQVSSLPSDEDSGWVVLLEGQFLQVRRDQWGKMRRDLSWCGMPAVTKWVRVRGLLCERLLLCEKFFFGESCYHRTLSHILKEVVMWRNESYRRIKIEITFIPIVFFFWFIAWMRRNIIVVFISRISTAELLRYTTCCNHKMFRSNNYLLSRHLLIYKDIFISYLLKKSFQLDSLSKKKSYFCFTIKKRLLIPNI